MPGGRRDSSKTRVRPIFDRLSARSDNWIADLLALPAGGCADARIGSRDLSLVGGYWEPKEKKLDPPVSLLSWLIRHATALPNRETATGPRRDLMDGRPAALQAALDALRTGREPRPWYVFEGPTSPDVFLITPDALVVIEGKRTEPAATVDTTWLKGRHQIWRHIDAAWEIRATRDVYGFFIVEGTPPLDPDVPEYWSLAARECLDTRALRSSFPHRSADEVAAIARCFLGVTTWRRVCDRFGIDWHALPDVTDPDAPR